MKFPTPCLLPQCNPSPPPLPWRMSIFPHSSSTCACCLQTCPHPTGTRSWSDQFCSWRDKGQAAPGSEVITDAVPSSHKTKRALGVYQHQGMQSMLQTWRAWAPAACSLQPPAPSHNHSDPQAVSPVSSRAFSKQGLTELEGSNSLHSQKLKSLILETMGAQETYFHAFYHGKGAAWHF